MHREKIGGETFHCRKEHKIINAIIHSLSEMPIVRLIKFAATRSMQTTFLFSLIESIGAKSVRKGVLGEMTGWRWAREFGKARCKCTNEKQCERSCRVQQLARYS
jgi:hypothetical protein